MDDLQSFSRSACLTISARHQFRQIHPLNLHIRYFDTLRVRCRSSIPSIGGYFSILTFSFNNLLEKPLLALRSPLFLLQIVVPNTDARRRSHTEVVMLSCVSLEKAAQP